MAVQDWTLAQADGRLQGLLPLVFHPLTMVRRAMATFLAPLLFLPPCRLADPSQSCPELLAAENNSGSARQLKLFEPFVASHYLPLPSQAMPMPPMAMPAADADGAAATLLGANGHDKIHLVGLLLSLSKLVALAQERALHGNDQSSTLTCMGELLDKLPGVHCTLNAAALEHQTTQL